MAVPTIPTAIAATDIQTEFGGSNPIGINEYYAGGGLVPSGTTNATSVAVPTSSTIAYSNFSGASAAVVQLVNRSYSYSRAGSAYAGYGLYTSGLQYYVQGSTISWLSSGYTWLLSGAASLYDIRQVKTSGSVTSPVGIANNTWYNISTDRTFYIGTASKGLYVDYNCTVSLRANATPGVVLTNCAVSLYAEYVY